MTIKYIPGSDIPYDLSKASNRTLYNKALAKHQRKVEAAKIEQDRIGTSKTVKRWKGQPGRRTVYYQGDGKWDTTKPTSKQNAGKFGDYESGLSFGEALKIGGGEPSRSTLAIGKKKSTKKPIQYSPSGDLVPTKEDEASKWDQGLATRYGNRKKTEEELVAQNIAAKSLLNAEKPALTNSTEGESNQSKAVSASETFLQNTTEELNASRGGDWEPTTVHTRHYKTGEALGVMTKNQRKAYEKEALGEDGKLRTFEGEMEKAGLAKDDPRRETKYTSSAWQRRQLQIAEAEKLKDEKSEKDSLLINEPA